MVVNIINYVGGKLHGKRYGDGKAIYSDGSTYDGEWLHGKRHWEGTYTYNTGGVYNGEWHNGRRHGQGRLVRSNGDIFEGIFADGHRQNGNLRYVNGSLVSYAGSLLGKKYNGEGVLLYRNGDRYEGAFVDGKKSGRGIQTFQKDARGLVSLMVSGIKINTKVNGKNDGQGVFTHFRADMSYSGGWHAGHRHGIGTITLGNHGAFKDVFRTDEAVCGNDAEYTDTATGLVSTGHAAVQLAREYGAAAFLPPLRKKASRLVDEMNVGTDTASSRKGKQKRRKIAAAAAAVAVATEPYVSDHDDNHDNDQDDDHDDDNSTVKCDVSSNAQACVYVTTVPSDSGSSDGKSLYSIGAYNTNDLTALIDHLEGTIDTTAGNYKIPLELSCAQGKQQPLLKKMCNVLIGLGCKERTSSEERFITTEDEIMKTYITCNGGHVNL
eukprot:8496-Heterococcus_DN1.PRE.6